jgi:hypothetical protein
VNYRKENDSLQIPEDPTKSSGAQLANNNTQQHKKI